MARKDAVTRRLWARALLRAAEFGFAPDCENHVRKLIDDGVIRLAQQKSLNNAERLAEAEQNLELFIRFMIQEAKDKGMRELHEPTFYFAKNKLCPLWPFCE